MGAANPKSEEEQARRILAINEQIKEKEDEGWLSMQLDESTFLPRRTDFNCWAPIGEPLAKKYSWAPGGSVAVMGAISSERGGEHFMIKGDGGFNGADFIRFIKILQAKDPDRKIMLFIDNCPMHKAVLVREFIAQFPDTLKLLMNLPYRPDLNGIEELWGEAKRIYRTRMVKLNASWKRYDNVIEVEKVLSQLTHPYMRKYAREGWERIGEAIPTTSHNPNQPAPE